MINKILLFIFLFSLLLFSSIVLGSILNKAFPLDRKTQIEHTIDKPQEFATVIADMSVVKVKPTPSHYGSAVYIGNYTFLTAAHVVESTWVSGDSTKLLYGKQEVSSEVIWYNEKYDLAILKIDEGLQENKRFVRSLIAQDISCERPVLGEELELVGHPFFDTNVHSFGRVAKEELSVFERTKIWKEAILISGPLAAGMSGGGVFNRQGEFVGINAGYMQIPNPVFSIPTGFSVVVPTSVYCDLTNR